MIPGPLVCEKDGRWHLVGTTSWGWGCGGQYYGVYTNIAELYEWIKENMKWREDWIRNWSRVQLKCTRKESQIKRKASIPRLQLKFTLSERSLEDDNIPLMNTILLCCFVFLVRFVLVFFFFLSFLLVCLEARAFEPADNRRQNSDAAYTDFRRSTKLRFEVWFGKPDSG